MARVYLEFVEGKWKEVEKSDFWMDRKLLDKLNSLKKIQKKNWDGVLLVDGQERSGKSVLGMICGWYLSDCTLSLNNFALGLDDVAEKIASIPDRSVIILDEGSTIFASKKASNKLQKNLMEILDVVGQKNLFFIVILPCFFDLNKTIAVRRSKFLLHVYPDEDYNRGRYAFWGESLKSSLYRIGKKNFDSYAFPYAEFVGVYPDFHVPFYEDYTTKIKKETLKKVLMNAMSKPNTELNLYNWKIKMVGRIHKYLPQLSQKNIADIMEVEQQTISTWLTAYERGLEAEKLIVHKEIEAQPTLLHLQDGEFMKPLIQKYKGTPSPSDNINSKDLNT